MEQILEKLPLEKLPVLGAKKGLSKQHVVGFAVGLGVAAVGLYLYRKNQNKIDGFLREQGIKTKKFADKLADMGMEELSELKEHVEDLIAEMEEGSK